RRSPDDPGIWWPHRRGTSTATSRGTAPTSAGRRWDSSPARDGLPWILLAGSEAALSAKRSRCRQGRPDRRTPGGSRAVPSGRRCRLVSCTVRLPARPRATWPPVSHMKEQPMGNDMDLIGQTAIDLAELVRSGKVTPRDVVGAHLERIRALDPQIGAF